MKNYKTLLLGFVFSMAFVIAMDGMANAQTANANAGAVSNSDSDSRSTSSSRSNASGNRSTTNSNQNQSLGSSVTFNQSSNTSPNTTANNTDRITGGTSNSNNNTNSGYTSSDNIVRTTPTVYAPPVSGGNPCTLAVSGGVSVIGWGAAAGGTFVDEDCATRQKIAMIHNAGYAGAAKELMCNDKATYFAFRSSGQPCQPRPAFDGTTAPSPMVQQQAPTPIGPQPVRTTSSQPFQPTGRLVCLNTMGREVSAGTPGASCGYI